MDLNEQKIHSINGAFDMLVVWVNILMSCNTSLWLILCLSSFTMFKDKLLSSSHSILKDLSSIIAVYFKCSHCSNSFLDIKQKGLNKLTQAVEYIVKRWILANLIGSIRTGLIYSLKISDSNIIHCNHTILERKG